MKMIILFASVVTLNSFAMEHLGEMKKQALDKIGRDMMTLESGKTCINGARSVDEFNKCNYNVGASGPMQKQETKTIDKKVDKVKSDSIQMMEDKAIKNQENY